MSNKKYVCMARQLIVNGKYSISTVQQDHIELIRIWRNAQMEVLRQLEPIGPEQQQLYFEHHIWPDMRLQRPKNILLVFKENNQEIGYGGLVHNAWEHSRAEVSFLLNPASFDSDNRYEELFTAFLYLISELAFVDLSFKRIFTETYSIRHHHLKVLQNFGFKCEGIMRKHVVIDGVPVDSVIHGLLNDDER